ncbi:MAG: hypothetical protein A2X49_12730 [Lentisphaerae bacterium GWF2_52_8]|nr:MAG: hypothetical protein A2X49_12730 [Lentisphaerae bacterium GWF2_52_8]
MLNGPQEIDRQRQESNKYENTCRFFARQKACIKQKAKRLYDPSLTRLLCWIHLAALHAH